ncbi:nicotinate-nucleotide adenylyltransferase [Clostridium sp.]|uniref:nicotinate-nucleotide adenylyltransferase n=1 Tax=Clostridium sp. TaxID=1506 RepID=UPI003463F0B4
MKVGVLGGTFDPIHNGHLYIAEEAMNRLSLDKLIFMPSGNPPHKKNKNILDGTLRYELIKSVIRDKEKFYISDFEILKKGLSYTYETLQYIKEDLGTDIEIYFITGADCLIDIYKWKNINELFKLCKFVVFYRKGFTVDEILKQKKKVEEEFNVEIIFLHLLEMNISSTYIREAIKNEESLSFLLPPSVEYIIKELRLYK